MKKIFAIVASLSALLTLLSLFIDIPDKIYTAYLKLSKSAPAIKVDALPGHQGTISVSFAQQDISNGYSLFESVNQYEIVNSSRDDITIVGIVNIFPEVKFSDKLIAIKQHTEKDNIIFVRDELFSDNKEIGTADKFPYVIKSGTKKYISVENTYEIHLDNKIGFCESKNDCYAVLNIGLGAMPEKIDNFSCAFVEFDTRIDMIGYRSLVTRQKAFLPVSGCKLTLDTKNWKIVK